MLQGLAGAGGDARGGHPGLDGRALIGVAVRCHHGVAHQLPRDGARQLVRLRHPPHLPSHITLQFARCKQYLLCESAHHRATFLGIRHSCSDRPEPEYRPVTHPCMPKDQEQMATLARFRTSELLSLAASVS